MLIASIKKLSIMLIALSFFFIFYLKHKFYTMQEYVKNLLKYHIV